MIWVIQPKFRPKKPVMNVRGRKIIDTSVSRLIRSAWRLATAAAWSWRMVDAHPLRSWRVGGAQWSWYFLGICKELC
jgi:hypothetical protein